MGDVQYLIFVVIILALVFDFINGFHDTANAIATSVSTRALNPNHATMMAACLNFLGAMVSTGVAKTIGGLIGAVLIFGRHERFEFARRRKNFSGTGNLSAAMAIGTATGDWRIIKTIGRKIFNLEPISRFAVI